MINLPQYAINALNRLKNSGYEAYVVGGCVRDAIMERESNDIDITTSASCEEIEALFPHSIRTGGKFLTVTVLYGADSIEITPFRKESGYTDLRRPDNIEKASSLSDDIIRRDFTINSICFDGEKTIDLIGGIDDIQHRIIRCIGNPDTRFREDALRILRAFRFSASLGFEIETNTMKAALSNSHLLRNISLERITEELSKILLSPTPEAIYPLLKREAFGYIGISASSRISIIKTLPKELDIRLAAFLELTGRDAHQYLPLPKKSKHFISRVFSLLDSFPEMNKKAVKVSMNHFGEDAFSGAILLREAIYGGSKLYKDMLTEISSKNEPYKISDLAVNGSDILKLGIPPQDIKKNLNKLLTEVIDSPELNRKETLIKLIK